MEGKLLLKEKVSCHCETKSIWKIISFPTPNKITPHFED